MVIDFIASQIHWTHHAIPIYNKLPNENKGRFYTLKQNAEYVQMRINNTDNVITYETDEELKAELKNHNRLTVVFAVTDNKFVKNRPVVFCEHGVGFTFETPHESYAGSNTHRENVVLFLCQNRHVYNLNKAAYPEVDCALIGIPKMDTVKTVGYEYKQKPVVCISFHWECTVSMFTRSAYRHYYPALPYLVDRFKVIGHGHPNIINRLKPLYAKYGIETVIDFEEVMAHADIYCNDSSSTLFEFAYTGKPVVVLNCPHYDKTVHVNHRFWTYADVGINVDNPEQLTDAIHEANLNTTIQKHLRRRAVEGVFTYTDGNCSQRAVDAILKTLYTREHWT